MITSSRNHLLLAENPSQRADLERTLQYLQGVPFDLSDFIHFDAVRAYVLEVLV